MCCEEKNPLDEYEDDCDEPDFIDEEVFEIEFYDYDIDDYWARAWTIGSEGFVRSDYDYYDGREIRVYPTRYRLNDFVWKKRLRRILYKNRDLKTIIRPFRSTVGKDELYTRHLKSRFTNDKDQYTLRNSYQCYKYSNVSLWETCVFKGKKLVACSVFFTAEYSAVGNIGFWDTTELNRSLGILTLLLEIQFAQKRNMKYYYLGNYIKPDPHYQYKLQLPALELWDWDKSKWLDFKTENERIDKMFDHKFKCRDDQERDYEHTMWLLELIAQRYPKIEAAAIIGSRANGDESVESDYDVLILTENVDEFLSGRKDLVTRLHRWRESKIETRGVFKVLRAFYRNNDICEFHIAPASIVDTDNNKDLKKIVKNGIKILHDPHGILEKLQKAVVNNAVK